MHRAFVLLAATFVLGGWKPAPDLSAIAAARETAALRLRQTHPAPVPRRVSSGTITSFDVPGAGTGYNQGTIALAINKSGTIAGSVEDSGYIQHGFVLDTQGNITTFDAPGAAKGTFVSAMDDAGTVVGTYADANGVRHGFSRAPDGTVTPLAGPDGIALSPSGIAATGAVAGTYNHVNGLNRGFRLHPDGKFEPFEDPGAGILPGQGTQGLGINDAGQIVGVYTDLDNQVHAYRRTGSGSFSTLAPPGSFSGLGYIFYTFTFVPSLSMNKSGAIVGNYFQAIQGNPFGGDVNVFIESVSGAVTAFGIGDTGPCCIFTYATGINQGGTVAGYDNDYYDINHGFVRTPDGTVTTFDAPGAGVGLFQGTLPTAINAAGFITGTYQDQNNIFHGFIRQP